MKSRIRGLFSSRNFWEFVVWFSLGMIFLWALAKSFGLIKTPFIIEMMPLFWAIFAAGGFFQYARGVLKEFFEFKKEIKNELGKVEGELKGDITHLEGALAHVREEVTKELFSLSNRITRIEAKL